MIDVTIIGFWRFDRREATYQVQASDLYRIHLRVGVNHARCRLGQAGDFFLLRSGA